MPEFTIRAFCYGQKGQKKVFTDRRTDIIEKGSLLKDKKVYMEKESYMNPI